MQAGRDAVETVLPLPGVWRLGPGANFWAVFIVAPLLSLFLSAGVVVGVIDGSVDHLSWACAACAAALSVWWAMFVWLVRWKRRRRPVLELAGAGGLLWRESRFHWMLVVIATWSVMLMGLLFAWAIWIESGKDASEEKLLLGSLVALGAWCAWGVVSIAVGRALPGEVRLTEQGVAYRRRVRTSRVAWDELHVGRGNHADAILPSLEWEYTVIRVRRRRDETRRSLLPTPRPEQHLVVRHALERRPITLLVDRLDGDPVQLLHALAWYAQHPEHRDELADGRALARVSQGRAVVAELLGDEL